MDEKQRDLLAQQITQSRKEYENIAAPKYIVDRGLPSYIFESAGLQHLFDYVRDNQDSLHSNLILDVGAGTTRAISEMEGTIFGKDLRTEAVVLKNHPDIKKNLGKDRTHVTSVERLRNIDDETVGSVISIFGIAYSVLPALVVSSIDRVLVPSGVVKAVFNETEEQSASEELLLKTPHVFETEFKKKGYDVITRKHPNSPTHILLAIKPPILLTAKNLLTADLKDWEEQLRKEW